MYEANDLRYIAVGDFELDGAGDLQDTSSDEYLSLRQEIATIASANFNDWAINPNIGANLASTIGLPNNQETADLVKGQIENALTQFLISPSDVKVDILPLDKNTLGVMISVKVGIDGGEVQAVTLPMIFNLGLGIYIA